MTRPTCTKGRLATLKDRGSNVIVGFPLETFKEEVKFANFRVLATWDRHTETSTASIYTTDLTFSYAGGWETPVRQIQYDMDPLKIYILKFVFENWTTELMELTSSEWLKRVRMEKHLIQSEKTKLATAIELTSSAIKA